MIYVNLINPRFGETASFWDFHTLARRFKSWQLWAVVLAFGISSFALHPGLKSQVKNLIMPPYRVVLSIAQADLAGKGVPQKILKVKTQDGLYIEIYDAADPLRGGLQPLLALTKLPDSKDGYFTFNGEVTNLVIDDIDNDGKLEVLASSFDQDMVAHLNIYQYNHQSGMLNKIQTEGNTLHPEL